jgi:acyl-CoA synthetase (AMP-forming)/AMP-acid ligase II
MLIEGAELEAPAAPLHELLGTGLAARPDDVALVSAERQMTWRQLEDASLALAGAYMEMGLGPGDRIASLMPNRISLVAHYLACFKAGLVATPLNYRYTHREIDHALEVSGASALLAHAERGEDLAASRLAGRLPLGTISYGDSEDEEAGAERRFADLLRAGPGAGLPPPEPADPAAIFFTSGSTGPAKGVTHTHEKLVLNTH